MVKGQKWKNLSVSGLYDNYFSLNVWSLFQLNGFRSDWSSVSRRSQNLISLITWQEVAGVHNSLLDLVSPWRTCLNYWYIPLKMTKGPWICIQIKMMKHQNYNNKAGLLKVKPREMLFAKLIQWLINLWQGELLHLFCSPASVTGNQICSSLET